MRNPGQYRGGRQQPRDCLAKVLLKSGFCRGCVITVKTAHAHGRNLSQITWERMSRLPPWSWESCTRHFAV